MIGYAYSFELVQWITAVKATEYPGEMNQSMANGGRYIWTNVTSIVFLQMRRSGSRARTADEQKRRGCWRGGLAETARFILLIILIPDIYVFTQLNNFTIS